jgi:preprotein translocase subunit Sec63
MLVDRFIEFLKIEWNDYLGLYSDKPQDKAQKTEKGLFDDFFNIFTQDTQQKTTEADKQQAYEAYRRFRAQQAQQNNAEQQAQIRQEAKYFDALEISPTKDFEAIKTAYKKVMKKYHPDRYAGNAEKQQIAQQISQKINAAYQYFEQKYNK